MGEIGANYLLQKAIKSCPKSNKSPNLVTLVSITICLGLLLSIFDDLFDDKLHF